MHTFSHHINSTLEELPTPPLSADAYQLVIVYGNVYSLEDPQFLERLKTCFPEAEIIGCSSVGEILNGEAHENSIVYTAIQFKKTRVKSARISSNVMNSNELQQGKELAKSFLAKDLKCIFILSEGLNVDCDNFISGIQSVTPPDVVITGGLAGDNYNFEHTIVLDKDGVYDGVVAVAFYGDSLIVKTASSHFTQEGTDIEITKVDGNLIYQINGKPALEVYQEIINMAGMTLEDSLAEFPIIVYDKERNSPLHNRSILGINEENSSLLLAGNISEGGARVIYFSLDESIPKDTLEVAKSITPHDADLTLLVTCAVRRNRLGDLQSNEAQAVYEHFKEQPVIGFHSFGEIGRCKVMKKAIIHNQTLTLATFHEA